MCTVTYLTIRPASFTCWLLLAWPFSLLNFALFPYSLFIYRLVLKFLEAIQKHMFWR